MQLHKPCIKQEFTVKVVTFHTICRLTFQHKTGIKFLCINCILVLSAEKLMLYKKFQLLQLISSRYWNKHDKGFQHFFFNTRPFLEIWTNQIANSNSAFLYSVTSEGSYKLTQTLKLAIPLVGHNPLRIPFSLIQLLVSYISRQTPREVVWQFFLSHTQIYITLLFIPLVDDLIPELSQPYLTGQRLNTSSVDIWPPLEAAILELGWLLI